MLDEHGKMPDVIVHLPKKHWLVLIEAVTSHGPINVKRQHELRELFKRVSDGLVFVTAFPTRRAMARYLSEIAWETEVWVAEAPGHIIHFNGERFPGPYE
ncbi:BsuBI/PstI family type II restriction endonuclease [Chloracidobacterium aggregatum]|uniref:BsuBI/PstI family type II restriction endonuclease n=1 Tax=Chloracidobacterium aggregatum TaxID=2851959 RepID=UPI0020181375|nr:BsuBI/PstI family type II restriction endonuclease [Chloracidobacterium aggregatum]